MRKSRLFCIATAFIAGCMLIFSGCKSTFQTTYGKAPICLAYPSEKGVIKDQSQVSTIIIQSTYCLRVDNIEVVNKTGKLNKELRIANNGNSNSAYIIDFLPGEHTLEVTYSSLTRSGNTISSWSTRKPIIEKFHFEPGVIYKLELGILDVAAKLMTFKKADLNSSNGIALNPIPDKYRQAIIERRNNIDQRNVK